MAGISFDVEESGYVEDMKLPVAPRKLVRHFALSKARAVAKRHANAIIIAADTVAVVGRTVVGKPGTTVRARAVLKKLSGRKNIAITGFTIIDAKTGRTISRVVETDVYFRKLTAQEINAYLKTGEPQKAGGGYTIQGAAAPLIKRVDGDFYNVVGLPLSALIEELKKFGIHSTTR